MKKYCVLFLVFLLSITIQQIILNQTKGNLYSETTYTPPAWDDPPIKYEQDPKHTKGPILGDKKELEEKIDVLKDYDGNSNAWFDTPILFEDQGKLALPSHDELALSRGGKPFFKDKAYTPADRAKKNRMNAIACRLLYANIKLEAFKYDVPINDVRIISFKRSQDQRRDTLNKSYKENGPIKKEFDQFIGDCLFYFNER